MVNSILEKRHAVIETTNGLKIKISVLNPVEWKKISTLELVLGQYLRVPDLLEGEKYVSANVVFLVTAYLRSQMRFNQ